MTPFKFAKKQKVNLVLYESAARPVLDSYIANRTATYLIVEDDTAVSAAIRDQHDVHMLPLKDYLQASDWDWILQYGRQYAQSTFREAITDISFNRRTHLLAFLTGLLSRDFASLLAHMTMLQRITSEYTISKFIIPQVDSPLTQLWTAFAQSQQIAVGELVCTTPIAPAWPLTQPEPVRMSPLKRMLGKTRFKSRPEEHLVFVPTRSEFEKLRSQIKAADGFRVVATDYFADYSPTGATPLPEHAQTWRATWQRLASAETFRDIFQMRGYSLWTQFESVLARLFITVMPVVEAQISATEAALKNSTPKVWLGHDAHSRDQALAAIFQDNTHRAILQTTAQLNADDTWQTLQPILKNK